MRGIAPAFVAAVIISACGGAEGRSGIRLSITLAPEVVAEQPDHVVVKIAGTPPRYLCYLPANGDVPELRDALGAGLDDPCLHADVLHEPPPNAWADIATHPIVLDVLTTAPAPIEVTISARRGGSALIGSIDQTFAADVPVPTTSLVVPRATPTPEDCIDPNPPTTNESFTLRGCVGTEQCLFQAPSPPVPGKPLERTESTHAMDCSCKGVCANNTGQDKPCADAGSGPAIVWRYYPPPGILGPCARSAYATVKLARCADPAIDGPAAAGGSTGLSTCRLTAACNVPKDLAILLTTGRKTVTVGLHCLSPRPYPTTVKLPAGDGALFDAVALVQPVLGPTDCRVIVDGWQFGDPEPTAADCSPR